MKFSSSSPRPVGSLATMRAATMALVVSAFLLGALWGGGTGQTAWAQTEPTPIFTSAVTFTPNAPTGTPSPSSTPSVPTVTNLPAFSCGDGATVKQVIWEQNVWTVTLACPNLKFKAAGAAD